MFTLGDAFKAAREKTTDTLQPKDRAWLIVNHAPVVILAVLDNQPSDEKCGAKYLAQTSELKKVVVHGNALTITKPEVPVEVSY